MSDRKESSGFGQAAAASQLMHKMTHNNLQEASFRKNFALQNGTINGNSHMQRYSNSEHLKTVEPKRAYALLGDEMDLYNGGSNGDNAHLVGIKGSTLHENDLFKIAVRNLSEQEIASNFPSLADLEGKVIKYEALAIF